MLLQIGDLDLNGIRNIARPFAEDVRQFAADMLETTPEIAEALIVVRRIMLTAEQVELHVSERGRVRVSDVALEAGWPYPYTAQAEARAPEIRDGFVVDAVDALHDVALRDSVVAGELELHDRARDALRVRLGGEAVPL